MNKVILMGRLTASPELRTTPQGTAVTRFTIAVDRRFKKEGGQQADFITCVAWRGTAEFICRFFQKGRMIAVEGELQSRSWDGQDGKRQYTTEVVLDAAFFAGDSPRQATPDTPLREGGFGGIDSVFTDIGANEDDIPF